MAGNQGVKNGGQTLKGQTPPAPASVGKVIGPSFAQHEVPWVVQRLIEAYLEKRESEEERFVDCVHRIGIEPFKQNVYGHADSPRQDRAEPALA